MPATPIASSQPPRLAPASLAARGVFGGFLMGLANLVPGISGGTMLLAAGIYPQFINGVAEVTTFRFRVRSLILLAAVAVAAIAAIVGLAGPVKDLVVHHRWIMYSIFIGLTLGGVPVIWRMLKRLDGAVVISVMVGIALMAIMALLKPGGSGDAAGDSHPYLMYLIAGLAGAVAMVLPGVSGGYLLLILGQYVAILSAIALAKDGAKAGDWQQVGQAMHVIVPVGIGVLAGIVGVSNLIRWLLARFRRPTLGVLLGLVLGAVIGLWPFQHGVAPAVGDTFRGEKVAMIDNQLVTIRTRRPIEPEDYPTEFFAPSVGQVIGALALVAAGFTASTLIARIGGTREGG
ncbi:MAG: DUF368 domain-containing protein [Phycisphaerales bacterium]|nr:MAG: DUF368 domain-containing protein [Phycisphaerales bacterium]